MRGADALTRALARCGVRHVFALSGNHVMPVFDAAIDSGLDLVHVRHEAAAVHMADAWGRLTGQAGVALVTGGPGHANAVSALYPALASESPLLLLSGHAPLDQLGRGAFQEMAQVELAAPVAKASLLARSAAELDGQVEAALGTALSGRPGPVHLSLPTDVLESTLEAMQRDDLGRAASPMREATAAVPGPGVPHSAPEPGFAASVDGAMRAASRPLILVGPWMMRGRGRALSCRLEEAVGVPVIGMDSPRGLSDPGLGAFSEVLAQADLVVLLGKPLDFTLRFGKPPAIAADCRFIHLDPDAAMIARTRRELGGSSLRASAVVPDVAFAAECLIAAARSAAPGHRAWRDEVRSAVGHRPREWEDVRSEGEGAIHPVEVCRAVQPLLEDKPDALLVCDGGEFGQWARACLHAPERITNGPSGGIGAGIPYAIAARLARPRAPLIAMMGDGSFGFHLAELETAARRGLPVVVVVGNDARWNAEHQIQVREYGSARALGCELLPVRYDLVASALGGHGELVTRAADLPGALARAVASGRPACVNVRIAPVASPTITRSR